MCKLALVGASGNIGSRILDEAVLRGHQVTAIVRNPDRVPHHAAITACQADVTHPDAAAESIKGADALIVSIRWQGNADQVLKLAHLAKVSRLIAVVGAGSLHARPGVRVIDAPEFPPAWRPGAEADTHALDTLRGESELNWLAVSPSWHIVSGERTGRFRLGNDELLRDEHGNSCISREDFAMAVLNEVEQPQHHRQRITVGY